MSASSEPFTLFHKFPPELKLDILSFCTRNDLTCEISSHHSSPANLISHGSINLVQHQTSHQNAEIHITTTFLAGQIATAQESEKSSTPQ
ncbi:hypothetical protein LB504_012476 [Fusarium proliferatum]|nr:hypothetical protein LB504_012476 [Fusarium proliferatum]